MMVRRHGKGTDTTKPFWMKITVLILNVRGLNEAEKSTIKSLVHKWKADIVCLPETKIEEWSPYWIRQVWVD